jgi:prepilin-type N-terminal cleavage/methylation domain-containing protein
MERKEALKMNYIKGVMKGTHRGQGGFTLIELLIVIAILGIVAAVVALNIGGFFGQGKQQAANTEAHQVQTAVIAYMAEGGSVAEDMVIGPEDNVDTIGAYLMNPGQLQAKYTIKADGSLKTGDATAVSGSQWSSCTFSDGMWSC